MIKERKRIFQDQDTLPQEALSDIVWEDLDGLPYEPFYPKRPAHNSKNLDNLAVICDRYKVSDRATLHIITDHTLVSTDFNFM